MYARERWPYLFTTDGGDDASHYGMGLSWHDLLSLDAPLPQHVPIVVQGDREYTQAQLKAARKRGPAFYDKHAYFDKATKKWRLKK